jgi:phosphatidylglycerophosphate synthase
MGKPLINSFDKYWIYTFVDIFLPFCENIHPNLVTCLSIIFKVGVIYNFRIYSPILLGTFMTLERFCDSLDGEIARKFKKCSLIGHYMDKVSDFIYWNCICVVSAMFLYTNLTFSVYWWIYFSILAYVPLSLVADTRADRFKFLGNIPKDSWFIYIEDNGSLFSLLIPYVMANIKN